MRLKDISTYRDDRDYRFYMKLTYVYEDAKGNEHTRVYPKVDFPLKLSLDLPIIEAPSFGPSMWIRYSGSQQISYGDVFIHTGSVSVPANVDIVEKIGPGSMNVPIPDISTDVSRYDRYIDVYYIDYISKPYVREMTVKEIEKILGHKVEIVSDNEENIKPLNIHSIRIEGNRAFAPAQDDHAIDRDLYPNRQAKKCDSCDHKCEYCTCPDDDPCWRCKRYSNYKKKE